MSILVANSFHCNLTYFDAFLSWQGYKDPLQRFRMLQNTVRWNNRFYFSHAIALWALLDWQAKLVLGVLNQFVAQSITGWNSDNRITLNLLRNYTSLLYSIPGHLSYFAPLFRDSSHDERHVNCQKVGNWQTATGWYPSLKTTSIWRRSLEHRSDLNQGPSYIVNSLTLISFSEKYHSKIWNLHSVQKYLDSVSWSWLPWIINFPAFLILSFYL